MTGPPGEPGGVDGRLPNGCSLYENDGGEAGDDTESLSRLRSRSLAVPTAIAVAKVSPCSVP
jgi:hypothetical protein